MTVVRRHWVLIVAVAMATLLAILGPFARTAQGNGVPTLVNLSYIDLSNSGPEDATGVAELIFAEGIVRVEAEGLPMLVGEEYQAWLVNSEAGDAISAGLFNADAAGMVSYEGVLPPVADFGFDLFILTIESIPDDAPQPTERRSIGGYFSLIGQPGVDGSSAESAGSLNQPGELPATGDFTLTSDLIRIGMLVGLMTLSVVVAMRLGRRTA
jgi:hypothetical protein